MINTVDDDAQFDYILMDVPDTGQAPKQRNSRVLRGKYKKYSSSQDSDEWLEWIGSDKVRPAGRTWNDHSS